MNQLVVLMYHEILPREDWPGSGAGPVRTAQGVSPVLPPSLYVWKDDFEAQMAFLDRERIPVVTPEQVLAFYQGRADLPDRAVLLTFDDLWKGGMTTAYPVLKRYGFRALSFLVRSWVFDQPQPLIPGSPVCLARGEWEGLGDVFGFANHTDRLHTLGPGGPTVGAVDDLAFVADLRRCEEWTTCKKVFAYPFGAVGEGALAGLRSEGFQLAFTTVPGTNDRSTDPLRLKRHTVARDLGLDAFAKMWEQ